MDIEHLHSRGWVDLTRKLAALTGVGLHINDKFEHLFAYAVLAFLPAIHEKRAFVVAAAVGAVALGVALEFGQLFLGWRDFEIADMIADIVGVAVGLAFGLKMRSMGVL